MGLNICNAIIIIVDISIMTIVINIDMSSSEEDNVHCWDYVMKFSLEEIYKQSGSEINQLCKKHISSKESFMNYVEDKRKMIRENKIRQDNYSVAGSENNSKKAVDK